MTQLEHREYCRLWRLIHISHVKKYASKWRKANRKINAERCKQWRNKNPEKSRSYGRRGHLMYDHNLTETDYKLMFDTQKGKCAICDISPIRTLHVDHCHKTGKIRGLLCQKCNHGLGLFNDSKRLLRKAIKYL